MANFGDIYTLCYVAAHGSVIHLNNTELNQTKIAQQGNAPQDKSQYTVRVPDNVLMIRIGNFGIATKSSDEINHLNGCYSDDIIDFVCETMGTQNKGFDIVPPGYPCNNMTLSGDNKWSITGMVFCESDPQYSDIKKDTDLAKLLSDVSSIGSSIGKPVLLIISHCMKTDDESFKSHSLRATKTALQQLPCYIYIRNLNGATFETDLNLMKDISSAFRSKTEHANKESVLMNVLSRAKHVLKRNNKLETIHESEKKDYRIPPYEQFDPLSSDDSDDETVENNSDDDSDADSEKVRPLGGGSSVSSTSVSIAILGAITVVAAFIQR